MLSKKSWDDKGTGHVACVRSPKKLDEWYLIVRLENEETNVLESKITESVTYQRQQVRLFLKFFYFCLFFSFREP